MDPPGTPYLCAPGEFSHDGPVLRRATRRLLARPYFDFAAEGRHNRVSATP